MNDKQILAGLLLDKDKAAVPEAISIIHNSVEEMIHMQKENYELKKIITAVLTVYAGRIVIDKQIWESISPTSGFSLGTTLTNDIEIIRR